MRSSSVVDALCLCLYFSAQLSLNLAESADFQSCPSSSSEVPIVTKLSDIHQDSYGRPGLAHMTIAGAMVHGLKEVEVWLQTFAPGSGTPIHRHACEEIFLTFKGTGTLYLASKAGKGNIPGDPKSFSIFQNTTFTIPVDAVHQLTNTNLQEDLQVLVIISRPPINVFLYEDWLTPHNDAKLHYPYYWDVKDLSSLEFCHVKLE